MKNRAFHFEIKDLITQFIAAFDDVIIGRFNKNREEQQQISVRYVYAPKQRVLYDIINKAQNITLPAVAVTLTSVTRSADRLFNKIQGLEFLHRAVDGDKYFDHMRMPVPVDLGISVSILATHQTDIDQIISNFAPYANPYLIISWKIPEAFQLQNLQEIRSEVEWDGNISLTYPVDQSPSSSYKLEASTSFKIKGWLFPEAEPPAKSIYFIYNNFHNVPQIDFLDTDVSETVSISAVPQITDVGFETNDSIVSTADEIPLNGRQRKLFVTGKMLHLTEYVSLSSKTTNVLSTSAIDFVYYPEITTHVFPQSSFQIINENTLIVTVPTSVYDAIELMDTRPLMFNLITHNKVGWTSSIQKNIQIQYI